MKIDRSRVRKSTSELPGECQQLIDRLQQHSRQDLLEELSRFNSWTFGKCELFHWSGVLDIFDQILGEAAERVDDNQWALRCDFQADFDKQLLLHILRFTSLLIEHSFSRHLYNSMEHLLALLMSNDMQIVLEVLNLLYMFSKRSNFITRLKTEEKESLLSRLRYLAETWGGKENGFGLAECCNQQKEMPESATTLHVEFHKDESDSTKKDPSEPKVNKPSLHVIHIEQIDKLNKTPAEIMRSLVQMYYVPQEKEMWLFTHVRLAVHFASYEKRLKCVQARLQALSVLVYSNAIQDSPSNLLYNDILEELVEVVELQDPKLTDIRCAALRTLTAVIHLDRNPQYPNRRSGSRLNSIIDVTGAAQYHGFLPVLVRNCISSLTTQSDCGQSAFKKMKLSDESAPPTNAENVPQTSDSVLQPTAPAVPAFEETSNDSVMTNGSWLIDSESSTSTSMEVDAPDPAQLILTVNEAKFPVSLTTALFSFLYHLASYDAGGEALVSCGMMESLLQVINWQGYEIDHITFVTRAVRVIDLITNIDMQAFQVHGGLQTFINRLDVEVNFCTKDQLYRVKPTEKDMAVDHDENIPSPGTSTEQPQPTEPSMSTEANPADAAPSTSTAQTSAEALKPAELEHVPENAFKTCLPQRAALLKSMLNFLKKAFQDATFAESIRHLMEGTLPHSLKNIIANAEYYGPSLFLLATDVVTVYVYQEPALLSALQDNGLTNVVLYALLGKIVPPTREVLGSLPNVFSALCLNARGLETFAKHNPFQKLFRILLSPTYLPAMRRRRSSEPTADTACSLGNAMDELMRHQPSLRTDATLAMINLLEELVNMGTDPKYICWRPHSKTEVTPSNTVRSQNTTEGSSDDEDDDEDEETSTSSQNAQTETNQSESNSERQPIALIDYILNTMKFIDAILSNNSTDDHCREFVVKGGLKPLLKILGLPNLPVDCPVTNPAQAVATVCKSILNLAHHPFLFQEGLAQLGKVLDNLKPLYTKQEVHQGSKLLTELANATDIETAFSTASQTPILHAMNAAHGYVIMFVHICRTGQTEIRSMALQDWGSDEGVNVLRGLAELYTALVWESTLLLAYCSDDLIPSEWDVTRESIEKLNTFFDKFEANPISRETLQAAAELMGAAEALSVQSSSMAMEVEGTGTFSVSKPDNRNLKYIKPLLGASSRLGRALAELFGLLVKLCVGSPIRQRRSQNPVGSPSMPSIYAKKVARALNVLLAKGLDSDSLPPCPTPKCRLTFLICSVGFTSPMLFDERRYPYYLMLKKFVSMGGQTIFFKTFKWALNGDEATEIENLPDGTLGFLDAWLTLLEKMVNPKTILESPHVINNPNYKFDALKYLIQIHKLAFDAIGRLWKNTPITGYGPRITETMLTILKHIYFGEKIIKGKIKHEELKSDLTPTPSSSTTTSAPPAPSANRENEDNLRQLMDMGFSREHAAEALVHASNLEQATEYLLSSSFAQRGAGTSMEVDAEDDQVMQAIAMSLGCNPAPDNSKQTLEELNKQLDHFTEHALDVCLELLNKMPGLVHKVCELLVTVMKRNGKEYRDKLLTSLVDSIVKIANEMLESWNNIENLMEYYANVSTESARRLANYIHLFILFYEVSSYYEIKSPFMVMYGTGLLSTAINLVNKASSIMATFLNMASVTLTEPVWLSPCLLLIDAYSKVVTRTDRKRLMHISTNRTWRWYDLVTGNWTNYSPANNKLVNDAYWSGEQSVRVTCGRKRYTVTFPHMLQINDETGNNRPIAMNLITLTHPSGTDVTVEPPNLPIFTILTKKEHERCLAIPAVSKLQIIEILKSCVQLLRLPIKRDVLHSVLYLCVRFTRDFEMAKVFVNEGGIKCLLNMKYMNDFVGFGILATVLIRHALEEPATLNYAMEKVIRGRALTAIPPPYRDLVYLTRQLGAAVTRDPQTFYEVANNVLRIDTSASSSKTERVDTSLPLKVESQSSSKPPPLEDPVSIEVVSDLLNALLKTNDDNNKSKNKDKKQDNLLVAVLCTGASSSSTGESSTGAWANTGNEKKKDSPEDSKQEDEDDKSRKLMLPKSVILKVLADSVVSYGPIAKMITEYTYKAGCCDLIKEDTSALAFIFDKIEHISDPECSTMCRMLIASLASANHSPEAQMTLVVEVKAALNRALTLPESSEKHSQIQHLCGNIISTMIDNCPVSHLSRNTSGGNISNIVKLMFRKGLFSDLAKVTHYLDLSSPMTSFTANAALKPLETLSRTINQPCTHTSQQRNRRTTQNEENAGAPSGTSTEGTNAQGEEIEDTENTEHDISAVASSLENNTVAADSRLEEMMEQILERNSEDNPGFEDAPRRRQQGTVEIDEDVPFGVGVGIRHPLEHALDDRDATEDLMSTDSGDTDSSSSDQENQGNEDNEGDDDNMDDNDDNDDTNYEDDENNETEIRSGRGIIGRRRRDSDILEGSSSLFRVASDRDEDVLMIHYDDEIETSTPRMIRWNENNFSIPMLDDNSGDHVIIHPLLLSRNVGDSNPNSTSRAQRGNRTRRYQYLFNARNPNPPVILQRLLGTHDPHNMANLMTANNILSAPSDIREQARVVIMDNFGIIPTNEEQIDFVDQSGYLFGPSLAATLSHVPPVVHWWNMESKLLDLESVFDCTSWVCNRLLPTLLKHRNAEMKVQLAKEEEEKLKKKKKAAEDSAVDAGASQANQAEKNETIEEDTKTERSPDVFNEEPDPNLVADICFLHNYTQQVEDNNREARDSNNTETPEQRSERERARQELMAIFNEATQELVNQAPSNRDPRDPNNRETSEERAERERQELMAIFDEATQEIVNQREREIREIDGVPLGSNASQELMAIFDGATQEIVNQREREIREIDGVPLGSPNASPPDVSSNDFVLSLYPPLPAWLRNDSSNSNSQSLPPEPTRYVSVQTGEGSTENVERMAEDNNSRAESEVRSESDRSESSNTFNMAGNTIATLIFSRSDTNREDSNEMQSNPSTQSSNNSGPFVQAIFVDEVMNPGAGFVLSGNANQAGDNSSDSNQTSRVENTSSENSTSNNSEGSQSSEPPSLMNVSEHNVPAQDVPQTQTDDGGGGGEPSTVRAPAVALTAEDTATAGPSTSNEDDDIPEGIDPSFLEALPPEIRTEVLEQHRIIARQQRLARERETAATLTENPTGESSTAEPPTEVSPEFLAALPPALQEEVLIQQRLEQQRQAAARAPPNEPLDAQAFFQTLQPSLRQMILSDMEDSQLNSLPPDLAQEAQNLRRDWYNRNRQAQERFIQSNLSIIRHTSRGRHYRPRTFQTHTTGAWNQWSRDFMNSAVPNNSQMKIRGRQLLDHEGIACLLILLFTDDPHLNKLRLHRVIRNLCYHAPTREWVINALLAIIDKSVHVKQEDPLGRQQRKMPRPGPLVSKLVTDAKHLPTGGNWLTIRMEAALGCAANVFIVNKIPGKKTEKTSGNLVISIHPQAAPIVCKNTLDLFTALAKAFPSCLLPVKTNKEDNSLTPVKLGNNLPEFWDVLLKLDSAGTKKGKTIAKVTSATPQEMDIKDFDNTVFGRLLNMLSSPVVNKNTQLTDNLLKLLSVTTAGMPQLVKPHRSRKGSSNNPSLDFSNNPPTQALNLAVNVLTYKNCSEEGLEFITNLLLNLASSSTEMSFLILNLLLKGAMEIGTIVETQIKNMLTDLKDLTNTAKRKHEESSGPSTSKGVIFNRFTNEQVVITASSKVKTACELQLPSMVPLTSKSSSQIFFLRVLRVVVQIRNSIKMTMKRMRKNSNSSAESDDGTPEGVGSYDKDPSVDSEMEALSQQLFGLTSLWDTLSQCLLELENAPDHHAVLVLQPAVEAFFLVHSPQQSAIIMKAKPRREEVVVDERPNVNTEADQDQEQSNELSFVSLQSNELSFVSIPQSPESPNLPVSPQPLPPDEHPEARSPPPPRRQTNPPLEEEPMQFVFDVTETPLREDTPQVMNVVAEELTNRVGDDEAFNVPIVPNLPENARPAGEPPNVPPFNRDDDQAVNAPTAPNSEAPQVVNMAAQEPPVAGGQNVPLPNRNDNDDVFNIPTVPNSPGNAPTAGNVVAEPSAPTTEGEETRTSFDFEHRHETANRQVTPEQQKFLNFAEKHRTVLNQILRQSSAHLADGPFAVLVDHTRILDFDIKRRYFRTELERMDHGTRRGETAVHVRRNNVFEDSFRELFRRSPEEWKNRFYIVFEEEEGQDAGGLLREWYVIISRDIFNPMYALFTVSPGDRVTYMINSASHYNSNHLCYYKFVGRVIAKAIYDNKLLECYFTRSFYKHILGIPVKYTDMESEDYSFYRGLVYLMENNINNLGLDLTFSTEISEFGVTETRDLIPNGRHIPVSEENKMEYVRLVCQMKMTGAIKQQLTAFLEGFYDIIPCRLISIFNEQELELLISGLPNVDIDDLKANTEYHKYQSSSLQIQWFWRALRSFDQADRAKFLQFVTGTSKVPLQGFGALEGMNGVQKFQIHRDDRSTDRLPSAHTCFNQLDLPVYETYDKLRAYMLKAIHECSEGFGFA